MLVVGTQRDPLGALLSERGAVVAEVTVFGLATVADVNFESGAGKRATTYGVNAVGSGADVLVLVQMLLCHRHAGLRFATQSDSARSRSASMRRKCDADGAETPI